MKKLLSLLLLLVAVFASAQTITVNQPGTGRVWNIGRNLNIRWTSQSVTTVDIEISRNTAGNTWETIAAGVPSSGSYVWTVTGDASMGCLIRIKDVASAAEGLSGSFIVGPLIHMTVTPDTSICAGSSVQLNAESTFYEQIDGPPGPPGPTKVYTYTWAPTTGLDTPTIATPVASPAQTTLYYVTVTDGTYSAVDSVKVEVLNGINIHAIGDGLDSVCAYIGVFGTSGQWDVMWDDSTAGDPAYFNAVPVRTSGIYCVSLTHITSGCRFDTCATIACNDCVWPGDANHDKIADNYDILPIGLGYGKTGWDRYNATIKWEGQQADNWADNLDANTNFKHADCNGDGVINGNDTAAILLNFGQTWSRSGGQKSRKDGDPELKVVLSPDTVLVGDIMTATISLGDAALPASNIYGLAFTVNYNSAIVDSAKTEVSFGNSWLGTVDEKIFIAKDFSQTGKIKLGVTRIDHTSRDGYGPIGIITFVITTDNINGKDELKYLSTECWISDLRAVDENGNVLELNEGADTAMITQVITSVPVDDATGIKPDVFPNPASKQVVLVNPNGVAIQDIVVTNVLGEVVLQQLQVNNHRATIDVSPLSVGVYYIKVKTLMGTIVSPVMISR